ncbi:PREDICTED: transcription factor GTE11 isoform X2 [Lupinus angustifolius]|uniref:transcription factor GTE11 isoform X2 n=1 Tax=Lupinus angustifolius TaxID=3871 RepID=UPI00092E643A|nr:PREDICTED: transcription factor GTE11 isoform X2 [Lupinus angustifolius]
MKRKRGHKNKKGKTKGTTNPTIDTNEGFQNKEQGSPFHEFGYDKDNNSGMEAHTPSSTGTYHNYSPAPAVGRVKVKLRTPKMLDSQPTSSDALTHSDTDKSNHQHGFDKHADRLEDSVTSLCVPSKRPGSIKIKSSKMLGSNAGTPFSACSEISHQKQTKNPPYNKQELDASLLIIRKVMKMDAAEPFNVPVNPEALGIPDYFNIIDTPMDFGTICRRLENNEKYMNSEDVFKDVQYIWDNCYKYNNKGDYILDLMRRVKKNFMKYWASVGLYTEPSKGTKDDIALSGDGKVKKQKTKKRHGRHHKHDCLCAICVLKRRRREREENARIAKGNFGTGGDMHTKEFKQEEPMLVESPGEEDSSSNTDESMGTDGDGEADKGDMVKMDISEKQHSPSEGKHGNIDVDDDDDDIEDDRDQEEGEEEEDGEEDEEDIEMDSQKRETDESLKQSQHGLILVEKSKVGDANVLRDEYTTMQQGQATAVPQQKQKESQGKHQRAKLLKSLYIENPKLASLCGILFPKNSDSVWSGAHSLIQQHRDPARTSSIHAAITSFME